MLGNSKKNVVIVVEKWSILRLANEAFHFNKDSTSGDQRGDVQSMGKLILAYLITVGKCTRYQTTSQAVLGTVCSNTMSRQSS